MDAACFFRLTFETANKLRGGPSLVFAHSLGNLVFRYFLEWLKLEIAPKQYLKWLDEHIHAYFAVGTLYFQPCRVQLCTMVIWFVVFLILGAPFLGAIETVKATLSGLTFGLPLAEVSSSFSYQCLLCALNGHLEPLLKEIRLLIFIGLKNYLILFLFTFDVNYYSDANFHL